MSDHETVARTLEQLAGWGDANRSGPELLDLARQVRDAASSSDGWPACPMCQEVECDDRCPLADERLLTAIADQARRHVEQALAAHDAQMAAIQAKTTANVAEILARMAIPPGTDLHPARETDR